MLIRPKPNIIAVIVLIFVLFFPPFFLGFMLLLSSRISFSEGQIEREAVVSMIISGKLSLSTQKTFKPRYLNLPEKYSKASVDNIVYIEKVDNFWEIRFLSSVSPLFGDKRTYFVYSSNSTLNERSEFTVQDFIFCGEGTLHSAEKEAEYWYYVACTPWKIPEKQ